MIKFVHKVGKNEVEPLNARMLRKLLILMIVFVSLAGFFYYQNHSIMITEITIRSKKIPQHFDGYRIVQLSDLHSKTFGHNQSGVIKKGKALKPDVIVVTGDLVDQENYNEPASLTLMKESVKISLVSFVTGNHEKWSGRFDSLEEKLKGFGVNVYNVGRMKSIWSG
jgi:predicted MPP superfamily phosphohydrolase